MAGNAKPNIKKLGKEGKIVFNEYDTILSNYDAPKTLIDGDLNAHNGFGVLLFKQSDTKCRFFTFTIPQKSNIWAYGYRFSDSGGSTGKDVKLYKFNDKIQDYKYIGRYQTKDIKEWYLLFDNLNKGKYKIEGIEERYVCFTEWFVESLPPYKFLIQCDDQYYTFNDSNIILSPSQELSQDNFEANGFEDATIITEEQWNDAFPDKTDLKLLMWTDDLEKAEIKAECEIEPFTPYDKLDNEFEICMATDKE